MTPISSIELIYCLKGENNHRDMYSSPLFLTVDIGWKHLVNGLHSKCQPRENLKESLWGLSAWYEYVHVSKAQSQSPKNNKNIKAVGYHQENKKYFKSASFSQKQRLRCDVE